MDTKQITYSVTFALRRGLQADLLAANEVPHNGEPIIETDTLKIKIGDGTTPYSELDYVCANELEILQEQLDAFFANADVSDKAIDTLLEIQKILNDSSIDIQGLLNKVNEFEALHKEIVNTHNTDKAALEAQIDELVNACDEAFDEAEVDRAEIRKEFAAADQEIALASTNAINALSGELAEVSATQILNNANVNERIDRVEEYYRAADEEIKASLSQETTRATTVENDLNSRLQFVENDYLKKNDKDELLQQMATLDEKVNALPPNELEVLKVDYEAHKEEANNTFNEIRNEFATADNDLSEQLNTHKTESDNKFQEATDDRAVIRSEIVNASSAAQEDRALIRSQYAEADNILSTTCAAENAAIRAEFAAADLTLTNSLNEEIARATTAEADALAQSKAYTDSVKTAILGSEQLESTFNTLTSIAAWIEGDGVNATELTEAIAVETQNRATEDAAIRQSIIDLNTTINTAINDLDIAHKAEIKSTNDTVAALGTELRGVDSNINARLDAAIAAHEAEDARIDAAYKAADTALVNDIDTRYGQVVADMTADYIKRDEDIIAYFDEQLGVIMNGSY